MGIGNFFRSLFSRRPLQEPAAGWAFIVLANADLVRRIVYVYVADQAKAEAIALEALKGVVREHRAVPESVLSALGVPSGGHKVETGNGWSFSMEGPTPDGPHPLIFVYLSDEAEAEAVLRKISTAKIRSRSVVPHVVLFQDLSLPPGGTHIM
jgi:hypothetical protein